MKIQAYRNGLLAVSVGFMLLCAPAAQAQNASPIPDVGRMQDIPGAHEVPDPSETYKIVFDLSSTSDKIDEVNPGLTAVAALVNTFAHFGVDAEHRKFVVLFHGATTEFVVNDAGYRQRNQGHANPNILLMQELSKAGVQLAVCGQSALEHKVDFKTIQPIVQVNYSATVTLMVLGMRGYVRITE